MDYEIRHTIERLRDTWIRLPELEGIWYIFRGYEGPEQGFLCLQAEQSAPVHNGARWGKPRYRVTLSPWFAYRLDELCRIHPVQTHTSGYVSPNEMARQRGEN